MQKVHSIVAVGERSLQKTIWRQGGAFTQSVEYVCFRVWQDDSIWLPHIFQTVLRLYLCLSGATLRIAHRDFSPHRNRSCHSPHDRVRGTFIAVALAQRGNSQLAAHLDTNAPISRTLVDVAECIPDHRVRLKPGVAWFADCPWRSVQVANFRRCTSVCKFKPIFQS